MRDLVCNVQVHMEGGKALARALKGNHSLISLNMYVLLHSQLQHLDFYFIDNQTCCLHH